MDIRSNQPFWPTYNGLRKSYPSLKTNATTEVLILGGGITGALISYALVSAGKNVLLVDRRDVCTGSSAASTAMLQYEIDTPLHVLIEKRGLTCAVESYRQCEKAIFTIQDLVEKIGSKCGYTKKKSIYFTRTDKDIDFLQRELQARQQHGFAVEWLDRKKLGELGLEAKGGIESRSGAMVDPYKFAGDLLAYCERMGLAVFDRTSVTEIIEKDHQLIASTDRGMKITAQHVVHCTGYESTEALLEEVVALKSTYAFASEAFDTLPSAFTHHIYWDTASPYLYFRSTADGRIIAGGGDEPFKNAEVRDSLLGKKQQFLCKEFSNCFPNIDITPDYTWAGTFGETADGLPYFGQPKLDRNEHYVLGFGGNGITFSVMGMEAILHSLDHSPHAFLQYYRFER